MLGALEIVLIVVACVIVVVIIIFAVAYRFVKSVTNDTPDADTLIPQVKENVNDKIILITGATSGIGKETVRVLSQAQCTIILAARNLEKANKLSNEFPAQCKFIIERLDLADLNQIKNEFLPNLLNNHNINKIDMFLCNGGVYPKQDRAKTKNNNIELAFGVNFLAHMYLAVSLKPLLDAAATDHKKSRLIVTSSVAHTSVPSSRLPNVNSDINSNEWKKTYDTTMDNVFTGATCYGWSKLCDLWFAKQFHKLYDKEGKIITVALHPGTGPTGIAITDNIPKFLHGWFDTIPQLAFTQSWLASAPQNEIKGGEYYRGREFSRNLKPYATNETYHSKLWQLGEKLIQEVTGAPGGDLEEGKADV